MRQHVDETREDSPLELWCRAKTHGDPQAWAAFQQSLQETVLTWFHDHPGSQAVCRLHSERHFVALAFERLRQTLSQRQMIYETLSEVLLYLRASLNGVILETLRAAKRAGGVPNLGLDGEDACDSSQVWQKLQALLSSEREQRLASLLFHCGLSPADIVRAYPNEWNDVHEVVRLRRRIFMYFLQRLADHSPSVISLERG
jgi:hypothetical protein